MIASAAIAAIYPFSKKNKAFAVCNGRCVQTNVSINSWTCQAAASGFRNCFSTLFRHTDDVFVTTCDGPNPTTREGCNPQS